MNFGLSALFLLQVANVTRGDPHFDDKTDHLTRIAKHFFNHKLEPRNVPRPERSQIAHIQTVESANHLGAYTGGLQMLLRCRDYQLSAKRGQGYLVPTLVSGRATMTTEMYRRMELAYRAAAEMIAYGSGA